MGRGWEAAAVLPYRGAYLRSFSRREIRECVCEGGDNNVVQDDKEGRGGQGKIPV